MLKEQNSKNIIECHKNTLCQLIADLSPDIELWENDVIKISLLEDNIKIDEVQGTIILNDFNIVALKYNGKEHIQIFTETYKKEKQNNYKFLVRKAHEFIRGMDSTFSFFLFLYILNIYTFSF